MTAALRAGLLALALGTGVPAHAALVVLQDAWMRPAVAGQASAAVFVDIRSQIDARLVGARSPVARRAELVAGAANGSGDRPVASLPVKANVVTRLAFRSDHLRLVDLERALVAGDHVPVELRFVTSGGDEILVPAEVEVRGLAARAAPDAEPVAADPVTAPGSPGR